jgi:hypothetical protein
MNTAERSPCDPVDAWMMPFTYAATWTEAIGEVVRASMSVWSTISRTYEDMSTAYAALLGQAIDLGGAETLALANGADQLLQNELRVLEDGTERLAHAAEETLADAAGAPLIPLPD